MINFNAYMNMLTIFLTPFHVLLTSPITKIMGEAEEGRREEKREAERTY